ncbi:MAG: hypothetical protein ACRCYU_23890, partial [Nocardioides sp.]
MSRQRVFRRVRRPEIDTRAGERLLAWAGTDSGHLGGTRGALYLSTGLVDAAATTRIPWEGIQAARWD